MPKSTRPARKTRPLTMSEFCKLADAAQARFTDTVKDTVGYNTTVGRALIKQQHLALRGILAVVDKAASQGCDLRDFIEFFLAGV